MDVEVASGLFSADAGAKPVTVYNDNGNVSVFLSAGRVVVTTPATGHWTLNARTSFGTITSTGAAPVRGFNAQTYITSEDDGALPPGPRSFATAKASNGELSIDIYVSYGDIEVRRATS